MRNVLKDRETGRMDAVIIAEQDARVAGQLGHQVFAFSGSMTVKPPM